MDRQKSLINSFLLTNILDVITTAFATRLNGWSEVGPYASGLLSVEAQRVLIVKTAVTVFLIGIFALTQAHPNRWTSAVEKAFKIDTAIVWVTVGLNAFQLAWYLLSPG